MPTWTAQRGQAGAIGRIRRPPDFARRRPNQAQVASFNILFETAMRPIADAADESMFYGTEVNVINMPLKVGIVPDRVLPVP